MEPGRRSPGSSRRTGDRKTGSATTSRSTAFGWSPAPISAGPPTSTNAFGVNWIERAKLTRPEPAIDDNFGDAVALRGDVAVVGAPSSWFRGRPRGAIHVFREEGGAWHEMAKRTPFDVPDWSRVGDVVALLGDAAFAGAPKQDGSSERSGATYVFALRSCAPCPADLDGSGAVDFADILAILAAWGPCTCVEDLDGSGAVDFGDVRVVLAAWGTCG